MMCEVCRERCMAEGGLCNPMTDEERRREVFDQAAVDHAGAHDMFLQGSVWRCHRLHEVEAGPEEAMRAAMT